MLEYQDTNPPTVAAQNYSLWDLGNAFITAIRNVAQLPNATRYNLTVDRDWQFARTVGPNQVSTYMTTGLDEQVRGGLDSPVQCFSSWRDERGPLQSWELDKQVDAVQFATVACTMLRVGLGLRWGGRDGLAGLSPRCAAL